jgi:hypothetical protein
MNEARDDPSLLLFTCEQCGFWPMAYQSQSPLDKQIVFACPRCRAHASFASRQSTRA